MNGLWGDEVMEDGDVYAKYYRCGSELLTCNTHQWLGKCTYFTDGHGNITRMTSRDFEATNPVGALMEDYEYDAYGNQQKDLVRMVNSPFQYCGEYYDEETGMTYLRARYYDPSIGRFISEDPVKDGLNWYVYCANDPVNMVDPSGKWAADGSDERFKESNPIVYSALSDLTKTWETLHATSLDSIDSHIDLQQMKNEVGELANKIREIGDSVKVGEPIGLSGKLNNVEKVLYTLDASKGQEVIWAGFSSRKVTERIYGNGYAVNDNSDAFRHSYWNAAGVALVGAEFTRNWTNAHEYGFPENFENSSVIAGTYMDLWNNRVGRNYGEKLGLGASEFLIEKSIIQSIDYGEMFRIINNNLVVTDSSGHL